MKKAFWNLVKVVALLLIGAGFAVLLLGGEKEAEVVERVVMPNTPVVTAVVSPTVAAASTVMALTSLISTPTPAETATVSPTIAVSTTATLTPTEISPTATTTPTVETTPALTTTPVVSTPVASTPVVTTPATTETDADCVEPAAMFGDFYARNAAALGCPIGAANENLFGAALKLERGYLFWMQANDQAYVLHFSDNTWKGDPEWDWDDVTNANGIGLTPPAGMYEPMRGLGYVWREKYDQGKVKDIGWAIEPTSPERYVNNITVQNTANGILLSLDGQIYGLIGKIEGQLVK